MKLVWSFSKLRIEPLDSFENRAIRRRARNLAAIVIPRQCCCNCLYLLRLRYQHHECRGGLVFPPLAFGDARNIVAEAEDKRRARRGKFRPLPVSPCLR